MQRICKHVERAVQIKNWKFITDSNGFRVIRNNRQVASIVNNKIDNICIISSVVFLMIALFDVAPDSYAFAIATIALLYNTVWIFYSIAMRILFPLSLIVVSTFIAMFFPNYVVENTFNYGLSPDSETF